MDRQGFLFYSFTQTRRNNDEKEGLLIKIYKASKRGENEGSIYREEEEEEQEEEEEEEEEGSAFRRK